MRLLGKYGVATLGVAAMLAMVPAKADAALLTITDTFGGSNTVWTLNIGDGLHELHRHSDGKLPGS